MSKLIKAKDGVEWYDDGTILLIRCPVCKRENYALAVAKGVCCWCGYKASRWSRANQKKSMN